MSVLIIEDDPDLNANIKEALLSENYTVDTAFDGQIGLKLLKKNTYDCVILDINLPFINGLEICKQFRDYNTQTPIIMLTAFGELEDKIEGYDKGADDYLTKPFFMKELMLRVNSLIKRRSLKQDNNLENDVLIFDDIVLNKKQKKVFRNREEVNLTFREYEILLMLMDHKGEVVSKKRMLEEIWKTTYDGNTNAVEVYINFLRNKLDKPFDKKTIKTKVGYGYYLDINED
ncbi:MAG TPA: response regulator transcription factor [Brumimicrobium sp.]|nr:response regulator transcription factor [Brumimicrobium sp.]